MQINPQLSYILDLVESQKTIELAKSHIKDVKRRLQKAFDDRNRLAGLLNEKFELLELLESSSLRNIFSSILVDRKLQLEMERQEYLQIVLQYNESRKAVELLEFELEILTKQIKAEKDITQTLNQAIELHRSEIIKAYPIIAERIFKLEKFISELTSNKKEVQEALNVAEKLQHTLTIIVDNLQRASDWGTWENMALSNTLEAKAKNRFVDKALTHVYIAQNLFEKFEKELQDIHNHQQIKGSYHYHDFGNFTEVYYNRLIADWVIQQRIKNSQRNVEGVLDNVNLITASLKYELQRSSSKIEEYKDQIDRVLKEGIAKT